MNSQYNKSDDHTTPVPIKTARWIWLIVAAHVLFLVSWAGYHEYVRTHGHTIWLKTVPVDPRDLLRGDYMILNYEISRHTQPVAEDSWENRSTVYVVFKPDSNDSQFHVIDEVLPFPPDRNDTRPWVIANARIHQDSSKVHFDLKYEIEKYFVPEGKGTPRFNKIEIEAVISHSHHLQIKRLWLDDKLYP